MPWYVNRRISSEINIAVVPDRGDISESEEALY